ncbi:hypothetical protein [Vibrio rarus]|uniref:hypothetical protein n=1 Tax=Vibrio rarus TaxID=413403 RepID=UPI0021C47E36|nr:hypothetical protein [Vibrio rarus]
MKKQCFAAVVICCIGIAMPAMANVHKWKETDFQTYSDKAHVSFILVNRYHKTADFYLSIDDKKFPNKITLQANQDIKLDISVNTPASQTTKKQVCTLMDTGSANKYEVCTHLKFRRM